MRKILLCVVLLTSVSVFAQGDAPSFGSLNLIQQETQSVTLPDDFAVWGIPLSMVMALLVQVLKALGAIKPDTPIKKSLGYTIALVGALLGAGWALVSGTTEPAQLLILAFSGAFVGLGAVGLHSAHKNFSERKQVG